MFLVMRYVGGNVITQDQEGKASVIEDSSNPLGNTTPVRILARGKRDGGGGTFFDGVVNRLQTFKIDSATVGRDKGLHSDTLVEVFSTTGTMPLLQTILFHTSCSKLLRLGDQFGGIRVAGWKDKAGNEVGIQS